jgi:hypothetical protein
MLLILDVQHTGRASRPGDMGAAYDLDSDGVAGEQGEREVDLVRGYVAAAQERATELGWTVHVLDTGEYSERHQRAAELARGSTKAAYFACHVNAGKGSYALVRPDYRSTGGAILGGAVASALSMLRPEITRARVEPLYPDAYAALTRGRAVDTAAGAAWWTRGWSCIAGIYAGPATLSGVLVEPGFIDWSGHRALWTPEGLVRVGRALVDGVRRWA